MKKRFKETFSFLLAMCMVLSVMSGMPLSVFAEGEDVPIPATGDFVPVTGIERTSLKALKLVPEELFGYVVPAQSTNRTIAWSIVDAGDTGAVLDEKGRVVTTNTGTVKVRATILDGLAVGTPYVEEFSIEVVDNVYINNPVYDHENEPHRPEWPDRDLRWNADPEMLYFEGKYYLYSTTSIQGARQVNIDVYVSEDLGHWEKIFDVIDMSTFPGYRDSLWAPTVIKRGDYYYMCFGENNGTRGGQTSLATNHYGMAIAISETPYGPFVNHLGTYIHTGGNTNSTATDNYTGGTVGDLAGKELENLIIDRYVNGSQPIDGALFQDDDENNTVYLYWGGVSHLSVVKLNDDLTDIVPWDESDPFLPTDDRAARYAKATRDLTRYASEYTEGPFMFKRDGTYYLTYSIGVFTGESYGLRYISSPTPYGPWTQGPRFLNTDRRDPGGRAPGHHSNFYLEGLDKWLVIYHKFEKDSTNSADRQRMNCIDLMEFDENGTIQQIQMTDMWNLYTNERPGFHVNLARQAGAVPMYSSEQNNTNSGAKAFDGYVNGSSRWQSGSSDPGDTQYLGVNFGKPTTFNQVSMWFYNTGGNALVLECSDDGTNWTPITDAVDITGVANPSKMSERYKDIVLKTPLTTQYLRARFPTRSSSLSIYEFDVYHIVVTDPPTAPSIIAGARIAEETFRLTWGEVAFADSYTVEISNVPEGPFATVASGIAESFLDITPFDASKDTYFRVIANNEFGASGPSAVSAYKTIADVGAFVYLPDVVGTDSQQLWYKLDEPYGSPFAMNALGGSFAQSITTSGVFAPVDGKINGAFEFNGIDSEIQATPNTQSLNPNFTERTIAFWMRPYTLDGRQMLYNYGGDGRGICIRINDGYIEVGVSRSGATTNAQRLKFWELDETYINRWTHVALTYKNGVINLYIDGELKIGDTLFDSNFDILQPAAGTWFGRQGTNNAFLDTGNQYFTGMMDDIRVYNYAVAPKKVGVTVTPAEALMSKGDTLQFVAEATLSDGTADSVTWAVTGGTSSNTRIDSDGLLTVGTDETALTLAVTATSNTTSAFSTAVVTIKPTDIIVRAGVKILTAGYAANIPVEVAVPDEYDVRSVYVALYDQNGAAVASAKVVDGKAVIRAGALADTGKDEIYTVRANIEGKPPYGAGDTINVISSEALDLWNPTVITETTAEGDVIVGVKFGGKILLKDTGTVKLVSDAGVTLIPGVSVSENTMLFTPAIPYGTKLIITELKYYELFPSYKFTFTINLP